MFSVGSAYIRIKRLNLYQGVRSVSEDEAEFSKLA